MRDRDKHIRCARPDLHFGRSPRNRFMSDAPKETAIAGRERLSKAVVADCKMIKAVSIPMISEDNMASNCPVRNKGTQ